MSNHKHHYREDECCAHEAAPTEINLNPSVAGNLQTTLHVAGVDCAEEWSAIQRALKALPGVRDVRVNIMSGKAIIAHDKSVAPEALIKAIGGAALKAHAKARNQMTMRTRRKNRDSFPSAWLAHALSS